MKSEVIHHLRLFGDGEPIWGKRCHQPASTLRLGWVAMVALVFTIREKFAGERQIPQRIFGERHVTTHDLVLRFLGCGCENGKLL